MHAARYTTCPIPHYGPTTDQIREMEACGFAQLGTGPLPDVEDPFPVRVSIPLLFQGECPFYLLITSEDYRVVFLVMDDDLVDELLLEMDGHTSYDDTLGYPEAYFWAELLEDGSVNFDTRTPCPEF